MAKPDNVIYFDEYSRMNPKWFERDVAPAVMGAAAAIGAARLPPNPKQAYGDKKISVHRVPPAAVLAIANALAEGAAKYGPFNWRELPVEVLTYYAGTLRHLFAWFDGEDTDPDSTTGKTHLEGAIGSLAILIDALENNTAIDNRPPRGPAPKMLMRGARSTFEAMQTVGRIMARDEGPERCTYCRGNDGNLPCLFPGEGRLGCLRDANKE